MNIYEKNKGLLKACKPLSEYAWLVEEIRENRADMDIEKAVDQVDVELAYQNKDIVSKLFGDQMKGKSLSLFGLGTDLKVVDARPTNIPLVQARELRMETYIVV